jgi:hypothetical protein
VAVSFGPTKEVLTLIYAHTEYIISMPNMYAHGILFGKMMLKLGDMCYAKNKKLGTNSEMEFKMKVGVLLITALSPYLSHVELTSMLSVSCCAGLFLMDVQPDRWQSQERPLR